MSLCVPFCYPFCVQSFFVKFVSVFMSHSKKTVFRSGSKPRYVVKIFLMARANQLVIHYDESLHEREALQHFASVMSSHLQRLQKKEASKL